MGSNAMACPQQVTDKYLLNKQGSSQSKRGPVLSFTSKVYTADFWCWRALRNYALGIFVEKICPQNYNWLL